MARELPRTLATLGSGLPAGDPRRRLRGDRGRQRLVPAAGGRAWPPVWRSSPADPPRRRPAAHRPGPPTWVSARPGASWSDSSSTAPGWRRRACWPRRWPPRRPRTGRWWPPWGGTWVPLGTWRPVPSATTRRPRTSCWRGSTGERDGYRLFEVVHPGGLVGLGLVLAVGREQRPVPARGRCGPSWAASTSASPGPAADWSTTTCTGGPASWTGSQLVTLLGEGTFHQYHGGASTSGADDFEELRPSTSRLKGRRYAAPTNEPLFVGRVPVVTQPELARSVELAEQYRRRQRDRSGDEAGCRPSAAQRLSARA